MSANIGEREAKAARLPFRAPRDT